MDKQVIQYAGEPVGIAVPENGKLKFIAVKYHVMDLDDQLFKLRIQKSMGQLEAPAKVRGVRRDLARIKTILREKQK